MNEKIKCEICKREFKNLIAISTHIKRSHQEISLSEYYKKFVNTNKNVGLCISCDNPVKFKNLKDGYNLFCSRKCQNNSSLVREKVKNTCLKRYGVEVVSKSDIVKQKCKQTCLDKYGVDSTNKLDWVKEKKKKTLLKNYGVDHPSKSEIIRKRIVKTLLKNYNVDSPMKSPKIIEKCKQTNLKIRGVEWSGACPKIKNKRKQTYFNKTGYFNPFENPEVIKKIKKIWVENLGVDNPSKSNIVQRKKRNTNLKKYNNVNFLSSEYAINKIKEINLKKYGVENVFSSLEVQNKIRKTNLKKHIPKVKKFLDFLDLELISIYKNTSEEISIRCKKCKNIYKKSCFNIKQGSHPCFKCHPPLRGSSKSEKEIFDFICTLINRDQIKYNYRKLIKNPKTNIPFELDIYIPDKQIAFEFDGLYWHSDLRSNNPINYHIQKTSLCEEKEIQLIHIFEDEWIFKKEIVKSKIKQILNINNDHKKINIEKCEIKEINSKTKNKFLDKFHILGSNNSTIKLGSFYNNELISIMSFEKKLKEGIWELDRFCSNSNFYIPGIEIQLLNYFKNNYTWKEIFSYIDRRWSIGNLYYQLGFELEHITKPDYWYVKDFNRINRFDLRKKQNEPKDIPEWILRQKEGYSRIWDCGSLKFNLINIEK